MLYGGHVTSEQDVIFLQSHEFDFGEVIFRDGTETTHYEDLRNAINDKGHFFLIGHGPAEGAPNDLQNLWNHYYRTLLTTIEIAQHVDIHFLTVHLWLDPRFVKPHVRAEKLRFLESIIEVGALRNILISLENLSENAKDLAHIINQIPAISLTLDVGHGQLLTKTNTSFDIINDLFFSIGHVHLHDNFGGNGVQDDLHLPIGSGKIEIEQIMSALLKKGYRGTVTLELKQDELERSLVKVRNMVQDLNKIDQPRA